MVLKGSVNFGPRGSTALGFGGHAHRAFPYAFIGFINITRLNHTRITNSYYFMF